jgi:AraC-like DNA-binding protein
VPARSKGTALWDITLPSGDLALPGCDMAGFRLRPAAGPLDLRSVPHPGLLLAVELGEQPLVVAGADGGARHGSVAVGLSTRSLTVRGSGLELLQVRLSPVVAGSVLGLPPGELDGGVVGLDDLWGADAGHLRDRLHAASWAERFAVLDAALVRRFEDGIRLDAETVRAWDLIVRSGGRLRVEDLVDETGWSRKRLWARFRAQLGLAPKRAARLARFDRAVHRLAAGVDTARVAAEGGFADQSHLHRDVSAFAGTTPRGLVGSPWLEVDRIAWPDRPGRRGDRAA